MYPPKIKLLNKVDFYLKAFSIIYKYKYIYYFYYKIEKKSLSNWSVINRNLYIVTLSYIIISYVHNLILRISLL